MLAVPLLASCAREPPLRPAQRPEATSAPRLAGARWVGCSRPEREATASDRFEGRASYYHDSLAGNRTASGQRYRPELLTAAHRKLPFGTRLRVHRGDETDAPIVCVTVNDRGPFAGRGRVLDLSRGAAQHLGMIRAGVVPVVAEVVGRAPVRRDR